MACFTPKNPMHISVSYCTLAHVMVHEDSCFQNMFTSSQGFKRNVFTPKSQMHISVSYCTLAYVMVYDG